MQSAVESSIGLPRRSRRASRMLAFLTPAEVSSSRKVSPGWVGGVVREWGPGSVAELIAAGRDRHRLPDVSTSSEGTDMSEIPATMRQLRSLVTPERELRLSVVTVDTPTPGERDVLVRVEAAPVNPSDLGLLLAMADVSQAVAAGSAEEPIVTA